MREKNQVSIGWKLSLVEDATPLLWIIYNNHITHYDATKKRTTLTELLRNRGLICFCSVVLLFSDKLHGYQITWTAHQLIYSTKILVRKTLLNYESANAQKFLFWRTLFYTIRWDFLQNLLEIHKLLLTN